MARLHSVAKIAEPLEPIAMPQRELVDAVIALIEEYNAVAVVVGMPRGLEGQETEQTAWVQAQVKELETALQVPVFYTDEAGTTKEAERKAGESQSVDSVAAGIIVEDFARQVELGKVEHVSF